METELPKKPSHGVRVQIVRDGHIKGEVMFILTPTDPEAELTPQEMLDAVSDAILCDFGEIFGENIGEFDS